MGAITPVLSAITPVLDTLTTAAGTVATAKGAVQTLSNAGRGWGGSGADSEKALRAQQDLAMKQLREQQKLSEAQAAEDAAREREKIAADTAAAEDTRRAALRRVVASQRAKFGAQGLAPESGSADAVLLGLFEESDAERARREELDTLRRAAIDSDLTGQRSVNLLQSAQLAQRQSLERSLRKWA